MTESKNIGNYTISAIIGVCIMGILLLLAGNASGQGGHTIHELLTDSNCQFACFLGIEPGVTTNAGVEAILTQANIEYDISTIGFFSNDRSYTFDASSVSPHFYSSNRQGFIWAGEDPDDVVSFINLPISGISVDDILNTYGPPTNVLHWSPQVVLTYSSEHLIIVIDLTDSDMVQSVEILPIELLTTRYVELSPSMLPCTEPVEICSIITTNHPTAAAGPDQTVTDADSSGSEVVRLDGSASSDPDGQIVAYSWAENGVEIATGPTPTVDLLLGAHTLTLTVTDDSGLTASDEVVITVVMTGQGNDNIRDLLSDDNCQAACFLGIEPGKTTEQELQTILAAHNLEYSVSPIVGVIILYEFDASAVSVHIEGMVSVDVRDGLVDNVFVDITDTPLTTILSLYGSPENLIDAISVFAVYPQEGLNFFIDDKNTLIVDYVMLMTEDHTRERVYGTYPVLQPCTAPPEVCNIATATPNPIPIVTPTPTSGCVIPDPPLSGDYTVAAGDVAGLLTALGAANGTPGGGVGGPRAGAFMNAPASGRVFCLCAFRSAL